mmetsp:Transcript_65837/g.189827  ORF Transcript_65837/g.189827 Transcript_65837/m.189827 type:complete len:202 (-) Transcript_65837:276-881(-)
MGTEWRGRAASWQRQCGSGLAVGEVAVPVSHQLGARRIFRRLHGRAGLGQSHHRPARAALRPHLGSRRLRRWPPFPGRGFGHGHPRDLPHLGHVHIARAHRGGPDALQGRRPDARHVLHRDNAQVPKGRLRHDQQQVGRQSDHVLLGFHRAAGDAGRLLQADDFEVEEVRQRAELPEFLDKWQVPHLHSLGECLRSDGHWP